MAGRYATSCCQPGGGVSALRRYARSFTGFERDARIFLVTTLIYGVALSLWWVDFNLYLTALGFDPAFIGISGTAGAVAGVLVAFPASILSDRLGRRIVLVLGAAGSTLAIAGLIVVTSPIAILACAAAMGAASQAIFVVQSPFLMEHSRPEHRNELFSLQSAILTMTSVGAALLGGAIAAIVGSVAGIGTSDPRCTGSSCSSWPSPPRWRPSRPWHCATTGPGAGSTRGHWSSARATRGRRADRLPSGPAIRHAPGAAGHPHF